ncbi:extracellular solute-binding protein [Nitzschia inconspicua]|uniref:Extracellular solute-binding protein n=1 Tax=Nitzschia inconspicua TaxID=303405 RepID=A0A9K3PBU5_9STRA|nr:extracellular solute-binding protein [Nitzschia inconspicua]
MKTALFLSCIAFWRATIQVQEENLSSMVYDCTLPGLEHFVPGQYEGVTANYLSFVTDVSSPNFPIRAAEFEACTGGTIVFSDANNIWEDPINGLGTKTRTGGEIYDGYFMSYSHFPEVSELDLAEHLNDRIRKDNARLRWEDVMPKVQAMSQYRKDGVSNIDFMMYDGDFFVPIIRLDLLEKYDLPMPNTWEELIEFAKSFDGKDINDDGEPDYSICHFPRPGAGHWDWWFSELVYSTWATTDQLKGTEQGFLFDPNTLEPNIGTSSQCLEGHMGQRCWCLRWCQYGDGKMCCGIWSTWMLERDILKWG